MKVHGNKEHKQLRVADHKLFKEVRLQSWFQDNRQRYWVVDESQKGESRDLGVGIGEDEDSTSGLSLGDGACVADTSAEGGNGVVEKVGVVEARDEQAVSVVINCEGGKEVIDDSEEVFSAFDDSEDEDYRESSEDEDAVSENGGGLGVGEVDGSDDEKGPSEVDVGESDDGDCTEAGDDSGGVSAVRGDKNIGGRESR
jgi:hypothetical protein